MPEYVYLDCEIKTDNETTKFSLKLDEQQNAVTHTSESGESFVSEGIFSANTVSYKRVQFSAGLEIIQKYEINREDLSIKDTFWTQPVNKEYLLQWEPNFIISHGICKIVTPNKNAF